MDPEHFRGWLQPGDVVRRVGEQLGELRERVVEPGCAQRVTWGYG